jgi:hypothetical protein
MNGPTGMAHILTTNWVQGISLGMGPGFAAGINEFYGNPDMLH